MLAHILFAFPGFLCVRGGVQPGYCCPEEEMDGYFGIGLFGVIGLLLEIYGRRNERRCLGVGVIGSGYPNCFLLVVLHGALPNWTVPPQVNHVIVGR